MLDMPAMAANPSVNSNAGRNSGSNSSPKPLGLVIQADSALLDNSQAAIGTTVFAGDALETQAGGTLRLRVGSGQLYLLASSAATLVQSDAAPQAHILRGTIGFSTTAPGQIEIDTPLGIIRAQANGPSYGQVRIVGPEEIAVTSFRGNLTIDCDGDTYALDSGKSYDVTLESGAQPASDDVDAHRKRRRRLAVIIILGGQALTGYILWQEMSESCHDFSGC